MTPPVLPFDPNAPEPYDFGPTQPAERVVEGDAQSQTRSDLGVAQGGEPSDSQEWLRSLRKPLETGPCMFCGVETTRRIGVVARQIKGRQWGIISVRWCQACEIKDDIRSIERRLSCEDVHPEARGMLQEMLAELKAML